MAVPVINYYTLCIDPPLLAWLCWEQRPLLLEALAFQTSIFLNFSVYVLPTCPLYVKTCLLIWHGQGLILLFTLPYSIPAGFGSAQVIRNTVMGAEGV